MKKIPKIQIGKQGITEDFISNLKSYFKKHKTVKISVLPSARGQGKEGKKKVKEMTEEISEKIQEEGKKYKTRVIGFTIVVKKL